MDRLHHDRDDLLAGGQTVEILLQRHADRIGERRTVLAEHASQRAGCEIGREKPARRRAHQSVWVCDAIGRLQRRCVRQADARDQPQIDVHPLQPLAGRRPGWQ